MKRKLQILSLSALAFISYGCNEKISPELEDGNSTTTTTVIPPTEYYFKVTNQSATVLNYVLHRTGPSNSATDCKISTNFALDADNYAAEGNSATNHDLKLYDITCFLEAEELSLYFNGLKFAVEASKNTCEYVAYSPYSYYDAIPGSTSTSFKVLQCGTGATACQAAREAYLMGATYSDGNPLNNFDGDLNCDGDSVDAGEVAAAAAAVDVISCGEMIDTSMTAPSPIPDASDDAQNLCLYDYETNGGGNGENCDLGTISWSVKSVSDDDPLTPLSWQATTVYKAPHSCGGSITSCVAGAIKQVPTLASLVKGTEIYNTELNEDFSSSYELPKLIGKRSATYDIVNYRKGLASKELNYVDYAPGNFGNWIGATDFDPVVMEKYAANKYPDNVTVISAGDASTFAQSLANYGNTPLAGDPYIGMTSRVNPFYTFLCMDRAFEIKARIRMVVRDWDKVFPSNDTTLSHLSDVGEGSPRQDLPSTDPEIGDDEGSYNFLNDKDDWDVLIPMARTNAPAYLPLSGIEWAPDNVSPWFNTILFPNQGPLQ